MKPPPRPRTPPKKPARPVPSEPAPHIGRSSARSAPENAESSPGTSRTSGTSGSPNTSGSSGARSVVGASGDGSSTRRRISSRPTGEPISSSPQSAGNSSEQPRSSSKDLEQREKVRAALAEKSSPLPKIPVLSTGVADRLAERAAIAKHDRVKRRGILASLVFLGAAAVWIFGFSSVFALDRDSVRVIGAHEYVKEQEVLDALASHYGTPLTRLNLNAVNEKVLGLANVKDASQTRRWPHGVTVTIEERVPVAAVPEGKQFVLLDISSVQVAKVAKAPEGLPVIKIPMTGENEKTLTTTLEILDSIPEDLLADIGSINASTQDNIVFTLRDGVKVQWGNSSDTLLKVEVLKRLRPVAEKENKKTIDLSAPKFPIIRG